MYKMNEQQRIKAPKTPLKRVSRNSLRTHTLSGSYPPSSEPRQSAQASSQAQGTTAAEPSAHLEHLAPLFVDLSDAITDLHINLSNLDLVCQDLDGFNEAFSAFIYGLRVNSYVTDFEEAPKLQSFLDAQARKEAERDERLREQAQQEARKRLEESNSRQTDQEESFMTTEHSMATRSANQASTSSNPNQTRSTNQRGNINHGASTSSSSAKITGPKPKNFTQASKSQQKQLLKFTEKIMSTLPLKFREQQPHRQEMELVISLLKLNPNGLLIKDIVKLEPTLAMHRARECATALVAAKKAAKLNKDGLLYKLLAD
ncbi:hypothetical protein PTTG_06504 [Puccinia triticina 1-1 BBBD Race 1]|uniref:DASH complex subunit DAM1 n=2 Tax=Puccinia triticina TaxID=208348 RepID=A0A180GGE9_PUCT1|nr:uncharacterized protein PtA15_5A905 [Puccinia triticina]OAV91654.1 hypothetical protein PTTG_06504 [Puccinia triticina 1-1 BBBD Race 1]WAQ85330.1 hypothetical protein PtA15_5A905 [Puccinia triticina]WAR58621.1 hypothetical protein PtB15_5B856 [Puccinia triticina]